MSLLLCLLLLMIDEKQISDARELHFIIYNVQRGKYKYSRISRVKSEHSNTTTRHRLVYTFNISVSLALSTQVRCYPQVLLKDHTQHITEHLLSGPLKLSSVSLTGLCLSCMQVFISYGQLLVVLIRSQTCVFKVSQCSESQTMTELLTVTLNIKQRV